MAYKPTKINFLTPRPCRFCTRWMSAEFLHKRYYERVKPKTYSKRGALKNNPEVQKTIAYLADRQGLSVLAIVKRLHQNGIKIGYKSVRDIVYNLRKTQEIY